MFNKHDKERILALENKNISLEASLRAIEKMLSAFLVGQTPQQTEPIKKESEPCIMKEETPQTKQVQKKLITANVLNIKTALRGKKDRYVVGYNWDKTSIEHKGFTRYMNPATKRTMLYIDDSSKMPESMARKKTALLVAHLNKLEGTSMKLGELLN
jgi:hypothetical protein|tara:strand:- start:563 stop:1033 length:471 start_codon:yes stop_codon:yes gene_type:complete